ncbi:MAG: YihY/virulence factor BrkB family protein [Prevotella sp.]|nr:YihY/virulence factor BrkB family protein [Prevotella sp.]
MTFKKLVTFFQEDIWKIKEGDVSLPVLMGIDIIRTVVLAIRSFVDTRITRAAAALSFSTMMAIVPMVAVVFGIARGFGISKHIESWFSDLLSSQPQVADTIIGFVNSYLVNAKSGVILGFGFVVMLYTVIMLISNVENTFNDIWKVENSRGLLSTIIDYVAFFFLLPIVITLTSGVSIFVTTMSGHLGEFVAPVVRVLIAVSPYIIMSVIFTLVYMLMPNTKVYFSSTVGPGIFAGIAMQLLQLLYIHSQVWVTSYNAIYGSFAALPLFMLWLQFSWIICLFGVHLCYTRQNMERLLPVPYNERVGEKNKKVLSAFLLAHICKSFAKGQGPYTALQLKMETGVPTHIIAELLANLQEAKLVINVAGGDKDSVPAFMPSEDIANITVGEMVDRLDNTGVWPMTDNELEVIIGEKAQWCKAFTIRQNYIDQLRTLKVTDLEIS